jgi:hypothetical protein
MFKFDHWLDLTSPEFDQFVQKREVLELSGFDHLGV